MSDTWKEIPIVVVSHKRAGEVTTQNGISNCIICIEEGQYAAYRKYHDAKDLLVHPNSVVGLGQKFNWIMANFEDVVITGDDMLKMCRLNAPLGREQGRKMIMTPQRAYDVVQQTYDTAKQMGAKIFSYASLPKPVIYHAGRPFKLGGGFHDGIAGYLKPNKLFWPTDPQMTVTDHWCAGLNAHFHRFHYVDNRFCFTSKEDFTGQGGAAEFRTPGYEKTIRKFLRRHFGNIICAKNQVAQKWRAPGKSDTNVVQVTIQLPWRY